jgi:hypothetical protein
VEQIRQKQTMASGWAKRNALDCGIHDPPDLGVDPKFQTRFLELVRNVNLAIIAQG